MTGYTKHVDRHDFPKGYVDIGKYMSIDVSVHLEIVTRTEDEYAEPDPNEKDEDYINNLRLQGELHFDAFPLGWNQHPIKKNVVGKLSIMDSGDLTSFNILFMDKTCEKEIGRGKLRRYFWSFFGIGKPMVDAIEIFPEWYKVGNINMNKVFTCTDFRGIWPVGVSSLVIAKDKTQARSLLIATLKKEAVNQPEIESLTLEEVDLNRPQALILNKGLY